MTTQTNTNETYTITVYHHHSWFSIGAKGQRANKNGVKTWNVKDVPNVQLSSWEEALQTLISKLPTIATINVKHWDSAKAKQIG